MENDKVFEILRKVKRGRYISLKKTKDLGKGVTKVSEMIVRLGVDYANMKINEGRQTGSLPWGQWVPGYEGFALEHKGVYYLRVTSSYSKHVRSTYFDDSGEEITRDQAAAIVGEKKVSSSNPDVYNIRFSSIISIGG